MNWKNCPFYDIFYELRMSSAQWVKRTSEIPFITYHCGHIFANGTDRLGDKRKKEKLNVSHWGICEQGPPTVSRIKLHPHTMFVTSLGDYPTKKRIHKKEKSMHETTTHIVFTDYGNQISFLWGRREHNFKRVFVCKYITETECLDSLSIHLANRLSRQLSETRPDNLSKTKFRTIPTAFLSRNLSKNGVNPEIVTQKGWKRLNNLKLRHFNFEFQNFFTFPAFEPEWGKNNDIE